jgi:UDP-N-acetylglucosamine--N-acetylmuramyl-(pentapeptide) pyrophosphoryl-undecaprenol N-acetylglucosamine transferase
VPPPSSDRAGARAAYGIGEDETCVLVFGGSLGARSINEAAVRGLSGAPFRVVHACGTRDFEALRAELGDPPPPRYDLRPYISPFSEALAASDLVVARSGGSIFEVAAAGRPAILIPYPYAAADHQTSNARWMAEGGAAVVIDDAALTAPRLREQVDELLGDPARLAAMARASAALARPDAARDVADELRAAAAGQGR